MGNFEEFLRVMSSEGYSIRQGQSKKHDDYFSFLPPGAKRLSALTAWEKVTVLEIYRQDAVERGLNIIRVQKRISIIR